MTDHDHTRPFADFLRETNRGRTHDELSDGLRDLVARVSDTGKKGALTLTINVEPVKGSEGMLQVTEGVKLRLPEHARASSIFYASDDGNLQREDPNQPAFDSLREVPGSDDPVSIREARDGTRG